MVALAQPSWHDHTKHDRLRKIIGKRSVKTGSFQLASGGTSDLYFDMKATLLDPEGLDLASDLVIEVLDRFPKIDAIGGLVIGACPIVTAVCLKSLRTRPFPGFYVRQERKTRGTTQLIDGPVQEGSNVVILDDVTTKGGSVLKAIHTVQEEMAGNVLAVITVVDREQGAEEKLAGEGFELLPLFVMNEFEEWRD